MSIRVFHVIDSFKTGGAQRQLLELLRHLDTERYTACVCPLIPIMDLETDYLETGIPIIRTHRRASLDVTITWRLARQMRAFKPDIVHTWLFSGGLWGRVAAFLARVPFIISSERAIAPSNSVPCYYSIVNRSLSRITNLIITNSKAGRDHAVRFAPRTSMVRVIHNGVDLQQFDYAQNLNWCAEYRTTMGLSSDRLTIGTVGRLSPEKGHEVLLQAVHRLVTTGYDIQAVIVGGGPRMAELTQIAADLRLSDRVILTGERHDIPQMNALFDFFVLPSYWEGFPNAILEAMAMALPVVATDVAGVAEAVQDGVTGWLVPPGNPAQLADKLAQLLDHPKQAADMGCAGRQRVEAGFSVEKMVAQTTTLYDELVATRKKKQL